MYSGPVVHEAFSLPKVPVGVTWRVGARVARVTGRKPHTRVECKPCPPQDPTLAVLEHTKQYFTSCTVKSTTSATATVGSASWASES